MQSQLAQRWALADRYFLHRAMATVDDIPALGGLDRQIEAMTLSAELREGSRRAGRTLLRAHAGLQTPGVVAYSAAVRDGRALGHLPIAQAVAWTGTGMTPGEVETVAAYALTSGIAQAAVRLSLLGPVEAQRLLTEMRQEIVDLLRQAVPDRPHAFTPAAEIAVMRHEAGGARLFAN
jgi:urease accessory protein